MERDTQVTDAVNGTAPAESQRAGASEPMPEPVIEPAYVEDELLVEEISIDGMCGVY